MANRPYDNFFLANEVEDQFNSHLDLQQFVTVNTDLAGVEGMKYIIHKYSASDSVTDVAMMQGNTTDSEATYTEVEYEIKCAQGRFKWYDEEEMKDNMIVVTGTRHLGTDMFNHANGDTYDEFLKAEIIVPATSFDFNAFVDGVSMFNFEDSDVKPIFALVAGEDVAAIRKNLKDSLEYVEAYVRSGYIGSVNGVHIYTKKDATPGTVAIATKEAVTLYVKKGTEFEAERDANTRMNRNYVRKYYVPALTDATKAVLIIKGATFTLSSDATVSDSKKYYAKSGLGYVQVTPATGDNPSTKGWYEMA